MKGYRIKRRRSTLSVWKKCALGWLFHLSPTLTIYTNIRPETLAGWHRRYVKSLWWLISISGKRRFVGRPKIDPTVEQVIVYIKNANYLYGVRRIAAIVGKQLEIRVFDSTVRNVLKRNKLNPVAPNEGQKWKTFLDNHREIMASMDFKGTFDWRARQLFILNIIDHSRRKLLISRATYNPSSEWVSRQIREAFPFNDVPRFILLDHDSIFMPVPRRTLPNMGIRAVHTTVGCPWLNGIVERFNRTLTEELLNHVIPISPEHLNRVFYNTARPHQVNEGESPIPIDQVANDVLYANGRLKVEATPWLSGLHRSYRKVA